MEEGSPCVLHWSKGKWEAVWLGEQLAGGKAGWTCGREVGTREERKNPYSLPVYYVSTVYQAVRSIPGLTQWPQHSRQDYSAHFTGEEVERGGDDQPLMPTLCPAHASG